MKLKLLLLSFMVVSLFTACSNESQDAVKNIRQKVGDAIAGEATATPTTIIEPTATPEPTATLEPTPTPEATATPEPTPTPEPDNCAPGKCSQNPVDEPLSVTFDEDGFYTKLIYGTSDFSLKINNIGSVVLTIEITPTIPGTKNTIMIEPNESKNISLYESKQSPEYNGSITLDGSWQISGSDPLSQTVRVRIVNS
tara:strand:- start:245 stop:835 length:591 start_codon:yes stop_codon:yes gene_type:complete